MSKKTDKMLDKMADEITRNVMKKDSTIHYKEGFVISRYFIGKMSEMITEWVEDFVRKEFLEKEKELF